MTDALPENYAYWQENGRGWFAEYARRKTFILYFHIQEIFLTEYVSRQVPAKVMEYGCGVGRHLRNLSRIGGVHVLGYDQSETMIAEMHHWATPEWINDHVRIGPAVGRLPFSDGEFDIVFTCEVLMHTRPEDIDAVLLELVRVCKGKLLHIEPESDIALLRNSHHGCWGHDLVAAYGRLGLAVERLPKLFNLQTLVQVSVGDRKDTEAWRLNEVTCDLFRKMEIDLEPLINRAVEEGLLNEFPEIDRDVTITDPIDPPRGSLPPIHATYRARRAEVQAKLENEIVALTQKNVQLQKQLALERQANANINVQFVRENSELRRRVSPLEKRAEEAGDSNSKIAFIESWRPFRYVSILRGKYYSLHSLIFNHKHRMQISSRNGSILHIRKFLLGERVLPWALIDFSGDSKYSIEPDSGTLVLYSGSMRIYGRGDWRIHFEQVPFEGSFLLDRGGKLSSISYSKLEESNFVLGYLG
jgi:SAM-dependent methyltransferase